MSKPHIVKKAGKWWRFFDRKHYVDFVEFARVSTLHPERKTETVLDPVCLTPSYFRMPHYRPSH